MNILIDGSDGSGKTSAIKYLQMLLERPVVKGSDFSHAAQGNAYLYDKFIKLTELDSYIFDRTHLSNLVYADLYKDYAILTQEQVAIIEDKLKNNSMLFYLHADLDTVIERVSNRGDEYVSIDMLESIRNKYEGVLSKSNLDIIKIDTTNKKPLDVAKDILRHAGFAANS